MHTLFLGPGFSAALQRLPGELRLAWIGQTNQARLWRLTETHFAFRPSFSTGDLFIGTLDELSPLFLQIPVSTPYKPPSPPAESVELDFSDLNISLDI